MASVEAKQTGKVSLKVTVNSNGDVGDLEVIELKREELEALSLADMQRLEHEEAARLMNVSRPTFSRILAQARRSVATALVSGAALQIGGGDFMHVGEARPGGFWPRVTGSGDGPSTEEE